MQIPPSKDLLVVAAFSTAVLTTVVVFAAIDPLQRTASAWAVGLIALVGLVASVFGIFVHGVDERLFRVSEYQRSLHTESPSTQWSSSTTGSS
jgi:hypothetical protein